MPLRPTYILSTSSAISPQQERTEPSGPPDQPGQCRIAISTKATASTRWLARLSRTPLHRTFHYVRSTESDAVAVVSDEVELPTAQIVPLGLIVNELVTNSVKQGKRPRSRYWSRNRRTVSPGTSLARKACSNAVISFSSREIADDPGRWLWRTVVHSSNGRFDHVPLRGVT
jgi:hypothetical protein